MRARKRHIQNHTTSGALNEQAEQLKAIVRMKVEHPFRVIKRPFDCVKVRYRGPSKNTAKLITLFALSNIWTVLTHSAPGWVRLQIERGLQKVGKLTGCALKEAQLALANQKLNIFNYSWLKTEFKAWWPFNNENIKMHLNNIASQAFEIDKNSKDSILLLWIYCYSH